MKKIFLLLIVTAFFSCSEETSSGVSDVTNYPNLFITGERIVVLNTGDTYTDAGATADAAGEPLDVITEGAENVDTSTPGVYKITYRAFNEDNFSASTIRTVIVLDSAPSAINLEGTFYRNGNPNNVTRLGDRVYICDNATGYTTDAASLPDNITLTFYNLDDEHVYAPLQENTSESGIVAESSIGNIIDQDHWNWVIYASAVFGTAVRNFSR